MSGFIKDWKLTQACFCSHTDVLALSCASETRSASWLIPRDVHHTPILELIACADQQELAAMVQVRNYRNSLLLQGVMAIQVSEGHF